MRTHAMLIAIVAGWVSIAQAGEAPQLSIEEVQARVQAMTAELAAQRDSAQARAVNLAGDLAAAALRIKALEEQRTGEGRKATSASAGAKD